MQTVASEERQRRLRLCNQCDVTPLGPGESWRKKDLEKAPSIPLVEIKRSELGVFGCGFQ